MFWRGGSNSLAIKHLDPLGVAAPRSVNPRATAKTGLLLRSLVGTTLLGILRFPFKGSVKGDIDVGIDIDEDMDIDVNALRVHVRHS